MQSDQNIHQNAPNCTIFSKFSRIGHALGPLAYMSANKLYLFLHENSHFSFKIYTKTHQS